jgi:hypothetical protein
MEVNASAAFDADREVDVGEVDLPISLYKEMGSPKILRLRVLRVTKTNSVVGLLLIPIDEFPETGGPGT